MGETESAEEIVEAMELAMPMRVMLTVVLIGLISILIKLYNALCRKPRRLCSALEKQRIRGPTPSFLLGNIPDMMKKQLTLSDPKEENGEEVEEKRIIHNSPSLLFPYLVEWSKQYGIA